MGESCAFPPSLLAGGLNAVDGPPPGFHRPRILALLVSAGLHALVLALLFAANLAWIAPAPPAVVEVRFVEIAGPTGGGEGGGRTAEVKGTSPSSRSSQSRPAAPARAVPAAAVAKPVATATQTSPRPEPKAVVQGAPPTVTPSPSSATSRFTVQAGASLGPSSEPAGESAGGPAGGATTGKAGSGSGPGSGEGSGGGAGTGFGRNVGPGAGQGGVAVDRMPMPVGRVKPAYPMAARRRGLNGRVVLRLFVDAKGAVREVRVQSAEPAGMFEDRAVEAVRRWRFTPAMAHGAPVGMWMTLPVRFTLDGR